ncbi:MAG: trehalose-phosphatase [Actinomycetota bacterium]
MTALPAVLEPLVADPAGTAVLLDFDGTLSEIVERPELAGPVDGARDAVAAAAAAFGLVAVVSGRPTKDVGRLLGVDGIRYLGMYGMEELPDAAVPEDLLAGVRAAADAVAGARVEDKATSVAVHYRQAADPEAARESLLHDLGPVAEAAGFEPIEGKMVVELVPRGRPRKGGAVRRLLEESGARVALYAGDDRADLEAFEELVRFRDQGGQGVRVAVVGPETPETLTAEADLTADGPAGFAALLRDLAAAAA